MKIKTDTIKNVNIGFPAEWECQTEDGENVLISYRQGRVKFFVEEKHVETINGPEGQFDIGGSMHDDDLIVCLKREDMLHETKE